MRCVFYLMCVLCLTAGCSAQSSNSPKHAIDHFLTTLLVHKNVRAVDTYISKRAYKNAVLLSADCIGTPNENITVEDRKKNINEFFKMIVKGIRTNNLKTTLKYDLPVENIDKNQVKLLASPKKNGYFLGMTTKLLEKGSPDKEGAYLQMHFPYGPYLILLMMVNMTTEPDKKLVEYPLYFIWLKENDYWKIIHINTMCM